MWALLNYPIKFAYLTTSHNGTEVKSGKNWWWECKIYFRLLIIAYLSISWASPSKEVSISVKGGQNAYYSKHFSQDCAILMMSIPCHQLDLVWAPKYRSGNGGKNAEGGNKFENWQRRHDVISPLNLFFTQTKEDITNMMVQLGILVTISFGS